MGVLSGSFIAVGRTDGANNLIEAQEPLASLQRQCGGELPGVVAIPELRELVEKVQASRLKLARTITAFDGQDLISAWVEITPAVDSVGGCMIGVVNWQTRPMPENSEGADGLRAQNIDLAAGEFFARLDARQNVMIVHNDAPDLADFAARLRGAGDKAWTDFLNFQDARQQQSLHWRLIDGSECTIEGSSRKWRIALVPLGQPHPGSEGFSVTLVADRVFDSNTDSGPTRNQDAMPALGSELSPILRPPIARVIANAEKIRAKMAGPLAAEYSDYAADIGAAGHHLLSLVDDLSDLEAVEADDFSTACDRIDAFEAAQKAIGMLSGRAKEKKIVLDYSRQTDAVPVVAEFTRVTQIVLNLLTNAIRYSPEGSTIRIVTRSGGDKAQIIVADEGPGVSPEQQQVMFEKFERLGRTGDGGSGLGLHISRRIARAMGGDLTVESAPGMGARFILELPSADPV